MLFAAIAENIVEDDVADLLAGDVIGGQRRRAKLGEFDIVEPRYGNIARDLEALFPQLAHHADGHEIVDAENRRGPKARFKQFARSLPAPLQAIRPREDPGKKYVRALDIETGKVVWERPQIGNAEGKRDAGLLATAGGLIFYGNPGGEFVAMDERNGNTLWHFIANGENKASPMTYMVGGKQFVAVAIGPNILCFGLPAEARRSESSDRNEVSRAR